MLRRLYFALVILFWVAMNVLLWRSEMMEGADAGSPIPALQVWQKILIAPDDSALNVIVGGKKLGQLRWSPNVGEELASGKVNADREELEGQVRRLSSYTLSLEGSALLGEPPHLFRLSTQLEFSTNYTWRKLGTRIILRPTTWELQADAEKERVLLRTEAQGQSSQLSWTFEELARPEFLLGSLGTPWAMALLGNLGPGSLFQKESLQQLASNLRWEARTDWLPMGHTRVRVYRLQMKLLEKYSVTVYVSRVGEILRVELPNQVLLLNEALLGL